MARHPAPLPLGCNLLLPCDVSDAGKLEAMFERIRAVWVEWTSCCTRSLLRPGTICMAAWCIAALRGSVGRSMCPALVPACGTSGELLMPAGASLLTVTFSGLDRAVANDNMMGPVKAALERVFRQTAAEPGPEQIGASAISPGPIRTRAASGGRGRPLRRTAGGGGRCDTR